MLWIELAILSAIFTSLTTILAKVGIKNVNSNFATAYRTLVVLIFSIIFCAIAGTFSTIKTLTWQNWTFLILSGMATGCSWLFYYKALQLGDVNKVAPIDKSSFILTSFLFLIFFFDDTTNSGDALTICMLMVSIVFISVGVYLMISKQNTCETKSSMWLVFAILSAVFASLVSLFVKFGLKGIPSSFGTLVRTIVVLLFAAAITLVKKDYIDADKITKKSWIFLTLSGIATGGAWLCEYAALNIEGVNPVAVNSISKLAIVLTMAFSALLLKEKFTKKSIVGLVCLVIGIAIIVFFSL